MVKKIVLERHMPFKGSRALAFGLLGALLISTALNAESYFRQPENRECPVLDVPFDNLSAFDTFYAPAAETTAASWGDLASIRLYAWVRFLYLEGDLGWDLEMKAAWDSLTLQGFETGDSAFTMAMGTFPIRLSSRLVGGWGLQLEADPGIYSTLNGLTGKDLNCPAGGRVIFAFDPDTAVFAGFKFYPGFDTAVVPRLGFVYNNGESFLAELAYPESRLQFGFGSSVRLHFSAEFRDWPEYYMGDDDVRKSISYDEISVKTGLDWGITDLTEITIQAGYLAGRKFTFEAQSPDVKLEDSPFFGIGIRGRM